MKDFRFIFPLGNVEGKGTRALRADLFFIKIRDPCVGKFLTDILRWLHFSALALASIFIGCENFCMT